MENIMKSLIIFLISIISFSTILADDVYFKNGNILLNVKVLEQENKLTTVQFTTGKIKKIPNAIIDHIEYKKIPPEAKTQYIENLIELEQKLTSNQSGEYKYPNLKLLPISVIAFTLSWSYFDGVSELPKKYKTKRIIQGSLFLAAGVVNLLISFKQVEVTSRNNMISLNYRF